VDSFSSTTYWIKLTLRSYNPTTTPPPWGGVGVVRIGVLGILGVRRPVGLENGRFWRFSVPMGEKRGSPPTFFPENPEKPEKTRKNPIFGPKPNLIPSIRGFLVDSSV